MMPCTEVTGSNEFFFYNVLAEIFFFYKTEILKTGSPSRNRRHKKHSTFISSSSRLLNHKKTFLKNRDTSENKASLWN